MNIRRKQTMPPHTYSAEDDASAAAEAARAIKFIEANLFDDLTVERIAHSCVASPFHFSRRFSVREGESVMSYVRGRRLDIAARRLLCESDTSVAQLALDCRFGSQAAFTRAFTRAFGIPPDKYRRLKDPRSRTRKSTMTQTPVLQSTIERLGTFYVAGLTGRYDPASFLQISELWKAFVPKAAFIGREGAGETVGVFRERDFAAQRFEHLAGARVAAGVHPEGLEVWTLPGREYLVFKQTLAEGELYPQVAAAQAEIWGKRLPASGRTLARAPDFQIYPADFNVSSTGWLAYYIPIE